MNLLDSNSITIDQVKEGLVTKDTKLELKRLCQIRIKRIIDILAAIVGILILIPLTITLYIYKLLNNEKSSIFYTQERIGKNGKTFRIYKFRTMVDNADEILEKYLKENEEMKIEYSKNKKLKHDPRVTKLGGFLRKTSLDEIPQFINIFKGEMSLVGPRPYLIKEKEDMGVKYNRIVTVKPGITGLWQVSGRSNVSFEERLNLDIKYSENKSIRQDIRIILKTFSSVIKREGAI